MRAALPVSETADGHGQAPITLADAPCNAVTNCCSIWTFDKINPASCCNCNAAERVFFLPMCSTQYSGSQLSKPCRFRRHPRTPASADRAVGHHILRGVSLLYLQIVRSDTEGTALTLRVRTKWCSGVVPDPMNVERALERHIRGIRALHEGYALDLLTEAPLSLEAATEISPSFPPTGGYATCVLEHLSPLRRRKRRNC